MDGRICVVDGNVEPRKSPKKTLHRDVLERQALERSAVSFEKPKVVDGFPRKQIIRVILFIAQSSILARDRISVIYSYSRNSKYHGEDM